MHATQAGTFGDQEFKAQVLIRPDILIAVLAQGYAVLWTDIDIVWLADPFPLFPAVGNPNEVGAKQQNTVSVGILSIHQSCTGIATFTRFALTDTSHTQETENGGRGSQHVSQRLFVPRSGEKRINHARPQSELQSMHVPCDRPPGGVNQN